MVKVIDKEVLSSDKQHQLKGKVYIPDIPDGSPKGLLHVVHGMTEYIGRYDSFMRELAEYGYIVFGYDHLGHGSTATDDSELGFIAHENGWERLVDDAYRFGNSVQREYGATLPFILMGHSMGSFIVRLTAAKYSHWDKLIVMGTGGSNPASRIGLVLCRQEIARRGERGYSDLLQTAAFGTYNNKFKSENDPYAWLSVKKENRDIYRKDKLCTYRFTNSAMYDLIMLNRLSNEKTWFRGMNKRKPILLLSGSDDPVGDNGKGVTKVYDRLKAAGANVSVKLYEGYRHEILNDYCRDQVIADIKKFID